MGFLWSFCQYFCNRSTVLASNLRISWRGCIRSLFTIEEQKRLARDVTYMFAVHADLVYEVTCTHCHTQNGHAHSRVFATFKHRPLTNQIVNRLKNCFESLSVSPIPSPTPTPTPSFSLSLFLYLSPSLPPFSLPSLPLSLSPFLSPLSPPLSLPLSPPLSPSLSLSLSPPQLCLDERGAILYTLCIRSVMVRDRLRYLVQFLFYIVFRIYEHAMLRASYQG